MVDLDNLLALAVPMRISVKKYARSTNVLDIPNTIKTNVNDEFEVFYVNLEQENEYIIYRKVKK